MADIANVEDLALDFTIPGYDIELRVCYLTLCSVCVLPIKCFLRSLADEVCK